MIFKNNRWYDTAKWLVTVVLPAIGSLYAGLCLFWGFPYCEQICGTIGLLETFFAALLGISSIQYKKLNEKAEKENSEGKE